MAPSTDWFGNNGYDVHYIMTPMPIPLLILLIIGSLLWLASITPSVAFAHAVPVSSTPAPNAVLSQAPEEIAIRFSERVVMRASSLQVFDTHGQRVDDGQPAVDAGDPWLYRVRLHRVEEGVYTISWRTMSADDGHVTEGAQVFVVGRTAVAVPAVEGQAVAVTGWLDTLARWLGMLGAVALVGLLTASLVFRRRRLPRVPPPSWVLPAPAVLFLSAGLAVYARLQQLPAEQGSWTALGILMSTSIGQVLAAKVCLAVALVGVLVAYWSEADRRRWLSWVGLVLGFLVLAADALVSHSAATVEGRSLAIAAQLAHLYGIALWLGGLGYFATLFWRSMFREQSAATELAWAIPAFSVLAVGAVGLLTVSGLYLAKLHLGSVEQLLSTPYGRTLLAKLTVVALMLGLGGYHQFIVHRRIVGSLDQPDGGRDHVSQGFKRTLRIEAALGLLALLLASSLGTTFPPSGVPAADVPTFRQARTVDDAQLVIAVWPLRPGPNTIRLTVSDRDGHALAHATAAVLLLQAEGADTAPLGFTFDQDGPGAFVKKDAVLGIEGQWQGQVTVQRHGAYDLHDRFELVLTSQIGQHAPCRSATGIGTVTMLAYLVIVGVTSVLLLISIRRLTPALQRTAVSNQRQLSHPDRR
jgi:copper transport protein